MDRKFAQRLGDLIHAMCGFHYDTAHSGSAAESVSIVGLADLARILCGTNFPMTSTPSIAFPSTGLDYIAITARTRSAVYRRNAAALHGRS